MRFERYCGYKKAALQRRGFKQTLDALRSRHRSRALGGGRRRSQMIQLFAIVPTYGGMHCLSMRLCSGPHTRLASASRKRPASVKVSSAISFPMSVVTVDLTGARTAKLKFLSMRESEARTPGLMYALHFEPRQSVPLTAFIKDRPRPSRRTSLFTLGSVRSRQRRYRLAAPSPRYTGSLSATAK